MGKLIKHKKKNKYDVTVKLPMSFEQAIKLAATTPLPNKNTDKKKGR